MKRTLIAGVLALVVHGFLMGTDLSWLGKTPPIRPKTRELTVTLSYFKPETPAPEPETRAQIPAAQHAPKTVAPEIPPPPKPPPPKQEVKPRKQIAKQPVAAKKKRRAEPTPPVVSQKPAPKAAPPEEEKPGQVMERPREADAPANGVDPKDRAPAPPRGDAIVEAKPLYRSNPPPEYPRMARRKRYQGVVLLDILVAASGQVSDARVHQSSGHPLLDRSALEAVKKWGFEPGRRGDQAVEMWVRIPVKFQLN